MRRFDRGFWHVNTGHLLDSVGFVIFSGGFRLVVVKIFHHLVFPLYVLCSRLHLACLLKRYLFAFAAYFFRVRLPIRFICLNRVQDSPFFFLVFHLGGRGSCLNFRPSMGLPLSRLVLHL